jgi:hypothetical protein
MTTFLDDLDAVDPATVEVTGPAYPVAQWLHGDPKLAAVGGVAHTGGLIMPTKYVPDDLAPAPGWTRAKIAFSSGKAEDVLATQKPRLAVIRTRFRWFVTQNGVTTYYPRAAYVADSGMRGHVQALCGVAGYDFPVVVTLKGTASKAFEQFLREFTQKTQEAAAKLLAQANPGARFPRCAFYLRLAPAPHVKVGQKGQESIVTPPTLELPEALTADYLGKVYVGREKLLAYQQVYRDAAEWAAAWNRAGADVAGDDGASVDPDTGEIGPRANPHNAPDDFDEFLHDEPPAPPAPRKPAALNVGNGSRWLKGITGLAKRYSHYADKQGRPVMQHILNAAAVEGFGEINDGNMEVVIERLAARAAAKV